MHSHKYTHTASQASMQWTYNSKKTNGTYIERTGIAEHAQDCTKEEEEKNVSNNKLDILQNYVFEMQGNDMLPLTYQEQ